MTMYVLAGAKFDPTVQRTIGEVQYPAGWFMDAGNRAAAEVLELFATTPPAFNSMTEQVQEIAPAFLTGQWKQQWTVLALPAEVIAEKAAEVALAVNNAAKAVALANYKASIRREADELEAQGLFVESFLKRKTIGE